MSESNRDPRVLAVDDSILIHRLLKERLRSEDFEIHSATCAHEGLALAHSLDPEVILLDANLPEMDGFATLADLKSDPQTAEIPVIVLSSCSDTKDKVRALDLGAIDFVTKPFDVTELKARVRAAIRLRVLLRLLADRARLDGLTGLGNRQYLDTRLQQEIATSVRHDSPLALLLCDLDRFKTINDHWGHPFGDRVLERFARLLSDGRAGDSACRYGGEEFAIIMPNTTAEGGMIVAERIRAALQQISWPARPDLQVTASCGVTDLSRSEEATPLALIDSADQALYRAKQAGRNCVFLADPAPAAARPVPVAASPSDSTLGSE